MAKKLKKLIGRAFQIMDYETSQTLKYLHRFIGTKLVSC